MIISGLKSVSFKSVVKPVLSLVCPAVLSTLMLAVRKYKILRQEKMATQELETVEFSEKILSFAVPETESRQTVPLRHPRRRERKLCREEVTTSIRMSLRHSHLIGPEDTVFQQFMMDRLAEADEDTYAPPFDCLHTYAFEGTGSVTGSLSSLESSTIDPCMSQTCDAGQHLLRLSPWLGAAADETSF